MKSLKERDPVKYAVAESAFSSIKGLSEQGSEPYHDMYRGHLKAPPSHSVPFSTESKQLGDLQMQVRVQTPRGPRYFLIRVTEQL